MIYKTLLAQTNSGNKDREGRHNYYHLYIGIYGHPENACLAVLIQKNIFIANRKVVNDNSCLAIFEKLRQRRIITMSKYEDSPEGIRFLQVSDIQRIMGVSRASAYALVKQKGFPRISVGSRIVIPFDLFNEWIAKTAASGRY